MNSIHIISFFYSKNIFRLQNLFVGFVIFMLVLGVNQTARAHPFGLLTWETKAPVISAAGEDFPKGIEGAAAGLIGGKIYVSHGFNSFGDSNDLRIYDIATDTWALGRSAKFARSELGGAVVDGKFYAIGGRSTAISHIMEIYDSVRNRWAAGKPMPTPRAGFGIAVIGTQIHVIGGRDATTPESGKALDVHEIYDTRLNKWFKRAPLPIAVADNYATVALDGKIYVFGGFDGEKPRASTQIYHAATDSWVIGSPMPTARSNAIAGVLGGHPIVIGGLSPKDSTVNLDLVEIYHPDSNSWTTGPAKPTPASEMASGAPNTSEAIYTVGSGTFGVALSPNEVLKLRECVVGRDVAISWVRLEKLTPTTAHVFVGVNNLGCETIKASMRMRALPPLRVSPPTTRVSLRDSAKKVRFVLNKINPEETYELQVCVSVLRDIDSNNDCLTAKLTPTLTSPPLVAGAYGQQRASSKESVLEWQAASVRLQLFNLQGQLLSDEMSEASSLKTLLSHLNEKVLSNGVYLAVITVKDMLGNNVRQQVKRWVVLHR